MPWDGSAVNNANDKTPYHFTVINGTSSKTLKGVMEVNGFTVRNFINLYLPNYNHIFLIFLMYLPF